MVKSKSLKFIKCNDMNMYHLDLRDKFTKEFYFDLSKFFAKSELEIKSSKPMLKQNKINIHIDHPSWQWLQHIFRLKVERLDEDNFRIIDCEILDKIYKKSKSYYKLNYSNSAFDLLILDVVNKYLKNIEFVEA